MNRQTRAPVVARITPGTHAKTSFPMLPWYPASFHSSTRGWSIVERGVYRELLDCQWELDGLPTDQAALRRLIQATPAEFKAAWLKVEGKFPIGPDGQRRNPTLERHRQRAQVKSDKARESAEARWKEDRAIAQPGRLGNANA